MKYVVRLLPLIVALLLCLPSFAATRKDKPVQNVPPKTAEKPACATPEIQRPGERQVFMCSTGIPFRVGTETSQDELIWEVQYQQIMAKNFSPCTVCPVEERSPNMVVHRFTPQKPGMYRLRVKGKEAGSAWSDWRTIRINSASPTKVPAVPAKTNLTAKASKKTKKTVKAKDKTPAPTKKQ